MAAADTFWIRLLPIQLRMRLAGRPLLQTLIQNAGWLVGDKLVRLGTGLFVGVWVARYLGPERFGALNYAQAVVLLVSALATMGLPDIIVRDFVRHPERARQIAATAIALRLVGALLSFVIAGAIVAISRPDQSEILVLAVIIGVSLLPQAYDVVEQRLQAQNNVRWAVIVRNSTYLLMAVAKVAAILVGASVQTFAWLISAEFFIVGAAFLIYSRRPSLTFSFGDADWSEATRLMRESWPLLARLIAIGIYMRVDQVLIGRLIDDQAVGIYAAATRISEIWYFIPVAIMTAFVPRLAEEHKRSEADYEAMLCKVMRAVAGISALAAVAMSLGAPFIIGTLYGPAFAAAAPVLAIHAWSGVFVGFGVASSAWFVNNKHLKLGLYQTLGAALVSLILNLVLVPRIGLSGAAWAAVGSYAAAGVLFNPFSRAGRQLFRIQAQAVGFIWLQQRTKTR